MPYLVVTDLDGTLLRPDHTVSERTREALRTAQAAGVDVMYATGRPPRWLEAVYETTQHRPITICANGALTLYRGDPMNIEAIPDETVEQVHLDLKDFSFLYEQGDSLVFMDTESYEQLELQKDFVGDRAAFLQDGMMVAVRLYQDKPIGINLPDQVTLTISEADPVVRGQTAASSYKPAILENGIRDLVPPFIESGERIVVDTNELTYLRRAD